MHTRISHACLRIVLSSVSAMEPFSTCIKGHTKPACCSYVADSMDAGQRVRPYSFLLSSFC